MAGAGEGIFEMEKMQGEKRYVFSWGAKTSLDEEVPPMPTPTPTPQLTMRCG